MKACKSELATNKVFGVAAILLGVFGFLIIIHRLSHYVYEYDPEFSPVDYGSFNILSFFTGAMATTYILVTGVVYTAGIPMGFTPPFEWHDSYHAMNSFIQVYFHMIIPPVMLVLWFFPFADRQVKPRYAWYFAIYPLVYSVFSIIRGTVGKMHFYPYPFYRPEFIWSLFSDAPVNEAAAYVLMALVLVVGLMLFVGIGRLMIFINDRAAARVFAKSREVYVRENGRAV